MPLFHPEVDMLRYREGDLDEEKKRSVDKHIQECAECREYLAFVDDFKEGLQELTPEELAGTQTCPDPELIFNYERGKLNEESARELRAHLLFCDACTDELYAIRRLRHPRSFTQSVIRITKKALQVVDISGTGEMLELAPAVSRGSDEENLRKAFRSRTRLLTLRQSVAPPSAYELTRTPSDPALECAYRPIRRSRLGRFLLPQSMARN